MNRLVSISVLSFATALMWSSVAVAQSPGVRAQGQDVERERQDGPSRVQRLLPQQADPQEEMRKLVQETSQYARSLSRNFIVVIEGGLELVERDDPADATNRVPAPNFMRALDDIVISGLHFTPGGEGQPEPKDPRVLAEQERLAKLAKRRGLSILAIDYAPSREVADEAVKASKDSGFVPFLASAEGGMVFDQIPRLPRRPIDENPRNITGIGNLKNFLYLTDSSAFDRPQDFVIALSNTNFDAIVVDVLHRGRQPFSRPAVQGMKFKKLGARRLVMAQMEVGRAETFRYYWQPNWGEGSPPFVQSPVRGSPDKHYVQYWNPAWKQLMYGNTSSYLYGIWAQGYDGVVLRGIDSYRFFEGGVQ